MNGKRATVPTVRRIKKEVETAVAVAGVAGQGNGELQWRDVASYVWTVHLSFAARRNFPRNPAERRRVGAAVCGNANNRAAVAKSCRPPTELRRASGVVLVLSTHVSFRYECDQ